MKLDDEVVEVKEHDVVRAARVSPHSPALPR
jgi:hypothetical protein